MLITFEGIDGSGKSTQIGLLQKFLVEKKKSVLTLREPGGTHLAERIRDLLLNDKNDINPVSELLLFEAARADLTEKEIIPALQRGDIVILDRYFDSTTAYQGFGRGLDLKIIQLINKFATYNIIPDITFYLRIPYKESLERRKSTSDRMERAVDDFFHRLIDGFDKIAADNPERFAIVDATKSINNVFEEIKSIIVKMID